MTHAEAVKYLQSNPGKTVSFRTIMPLGNGFKFINCWLEDGELVRSHPTDIGTCSAPKDVVYGWEGSALISTTEEKAMSN